MLAFYFIQYKLPRQSEEKKFALAETIMIFFGIFAKQRKNSLNEFFYFEEIYSPPRSWSGRTLIATLWIASVFLMATFGASVISLFARGTSKLPFDSENILNF